jgi:putative transposase
LAKRARIILKMSEGMSNRAISQQMGIARFTVKEWRKRWLRMGPRLKAAQGEEVEERALKRVIEEALSDEPRSGAPSRFSADQVAMIVAVACENPEDSGRPITEWTPRELKEEAEKRGIVEKISVRSVGRFLKSGGAKAT